MSKYNNHLQYDGRSYRYHEILPDQLRFQISVHDLEYHFSTLISGKFRITSLHTREVNRGSKYEMYIELTEYVDNGGQFISHKVLYIDRNFICKLLNEPVKGFTIGVIESPAFQSPRIEFNIETVKPERYKLPQYEPWDLPELDYKTLLKEDGIKKFKH